MDDQKRSDDGMAQRRKVLGDAWVDKSIAGKNSFNADFIDLITRHAWGAAAFRSSHPACAGDRDYGRARTMGRVPPSRPRSPYRGRLYARRYQGNIAAAGDLLRRAGRQPRGQGGLRGTRGIGAAEGIDRLRSCAIDPRS